MTSSAVGAGWSTARRDSTGVSRVISTGRRYDLGHATAPPSRALDILKALGDNTRYAIYLELARSPLPLATAEIAETLGLHPNTVRPHLERMREVGLLEVESRGPRRRRPPAAPLLAGRRRPVARPRAAAVPDAGPHAAAPGRGRRGRGRGGRRGRAASRAGPTPPGASPARSVPRGARHRAGRARASTPPWPTTTTRRHHRLRPLPVPGAGRGAPRPRVQPAPGPGRGLGRRRCGGGRWSSFHTLVDRTPCQVDLVLPTTRPMSRWCRRSSGRTAQEDPRDHPHRHRRRQGQGPHRGRRRGRAGAPRRRAPRRLLRASATRCSSTPTSRPTTSPPTTPA